MASVFRRWITLALGAIAIAGCQAPSTPPTGAVQVTPTLANRLPVSVRLTDRPAAPRHVAALPASWDQARLYFYSGTAKTAVSAASVVKASFNDFSGAATPYFETQPGVAFPVNRPSADYVVGADLHTNGTPLLLEAFGWATGQTLQAGANAITVPILNNLNTSTLAGGGTLDGTGTAAIFDSPWGVAPDGAGNVFVADTYNHLIRKVNLATGAVTTIAGEGFSNYNDDYGPWARFNSPAGMHYDAPRGILYVADYGNYRIRKLTYDGVAGMYKVETVAGCGIYGYQDGPGTAALESDKAQFTNPGDVVADSTGTILYVADRYTHCVRKIDLSQPTTSATYVTTIAGAPWTAGFVDGTGGAGGTARFNTPSSLALSSDDKTLYVGDYWNYSVRKIDLSVSPVQVTTVVGNGFWGYSDTTPATSGQISVPAGLLLSPDDQTLYIADMFNNVVRRYRVATTALETLAGLGSSPGYHDDPNQWAAQFLNPQGLCFDGTDVLVTERSNHDIRRIVDTVGTSTVAGSVGAGYADGTKAASRFRQVSAVAAGPGGKVFVSDTTNQRIRRIDTALPDTDAGYVKTIGGSGNPDVVDGAASAFNYPMGLAADAAGNVYVADSQSNRIRKLTWDSVADTYTASTIAGSGGYGNADGAALSATFSNPVDVAVDAAGNVFVADQYNNIVRKVTYSGGVYTTVSTIPAPLSSTISGIDVDQWGHLYVSDLWGMRVLKLTYNPDTGTYTPGVFAGSGTWGSADGPGASATFGAPAFLAVDLGGNVHVADSYNHIIRKIAPDGYVTREGGLADWFGYGTADGGRDASRFKFPTGIAVSTDGTLYVGDRDNHLIRKIK